MPKHLVRYKGEFEDMQSSPTTTAQCDDILNTIQVTQLSLIIHMFTTISEITEA